MTSGDRAAPSRAAAGASHAAAGATSRAAAEISRLLAAAEPTTPRPLRELIGRLEASGRLRGVRPAPAAPGATGRAADSLESEAVPAPAPASLPVPAPGSPSGIGTPVVRGLTFDSRQVVAGSVFVAVSGVHADGHDFVTAAASAGALAAIVERSVAGAPLPQLVVDDSRRALAAAAAWWYGDPSRELGIVGITGTDGKTTTSFLAAAILAASGVSAGLITTAAVAVGKDRTANPEHVTTPEAPQLQRLLRAMVLAGNAAAVVETTSHGLALHRVDEIAYDVAIFTNLTHEHLELHGTFEAYRAAKLSLFERLDAAGPSKKLTRSWPRTAIVNADDPAGPLFVAAARHAGARVLTYGEAEGVDVRVTAVTEGPRTLRMEVATGRWSGGVELQLAGRFNVHNALAAIALGESLDLEPDRVRGALAGVAGVPGRMERVDCGQPFGVIVDYAHSPASLAKVLEALAPAAAAGGGGLIAVFGSAGERDVGKRPMMGRIAGERCRLVVVADEDPRGEDRDRILEEIAAGARAAGLREGLDLLCIADRRAAVEEAIGRAGPGDVVLLAGKGHEQTIIMADGPHPWDERTEAVRALRRLGYRDANGAAERTDRANTETSRCGLA
jgi:UDP-N-acetylmuramoyl-L-alanyl-D-glutamate--2,6-diaminopimelate ligase